MDELEDYVEFKIKKYSKYDIEIIYLTYIQETLNTDPEIFESFLQKYKKSLEEVGKKKGFLVVNSKEIKNVDFTYIWSKMGAIAKLDDLAREYLVGTVYIIKNTFFKTMGNSIMKLFL